MPLCKTNWRFLSPSAHLIVDPASGARGIIRDTRADGAYRFHWSVICTAESLPITAGAPESLRGRDRWPKWLSAHASRTGASNPTGRGRWLRWGWFRPC